jgi:hypothetical protein
MTTQLLMSTSVIAPPLPPVAPPYEPTTEPDAKSVELKRIVPIADRVIAPSSCPLPPAAPQDVVTAPVSGTVKRCALYQANHQAELLCLQAEVDALWQRLQAIQQEKRSLAMLE